MRTTVLAERARCTGCGACVSVCRRGAIRMQADAEGFLYPAVDAARCVECGACEARCPAGREHPERDVRAFGAQNTDEAVRRASSSGGAFTALARQTLARGGVVFGAAFGGGFRVEHVGALDEKGIVPMRGSKYVQSDASEAIAQAAELLERGERVLFSGTPCQIDGLLARVGTDWGDRLLTVDFVCHGVPSPGVFASYLRAMEEEQGSAVTAYAFRDKRRGWKDFSAVATFADGTERAGTQADEPFLRGFLANLYLRPSCAVCTALRGARHAADLTLADLWGAGDICPERDDDAGLSLVLVNTPAGRQALDACAGELAVFPVDASRLTRANPSLIAPAKPHPRRARFFRAYRRNGFSSTLVERLLAPPGRLERLVRRIASLPGALLRRLRKAARG